VLGIAVCGLGNGERRKKRGIIIAANTPGQLLTTGFGIQKAGYCKSIKQSSWVGDAGKKEYRIYCAQNNKKRECWKTETNFGEPHMAQE
jgi:hypothetical protein